MGQISTPTFRVELLASQHTTTPFAWRTKSNGRANAANLAKYVRALEASTAPGGCNSRIGPMHILVARIVRQSSGEIVAQYENVPHVDIGRSNF